MPNACWLATLTESSSSGFSQRPCFKNENVVKWLRKIPDIEVHVQYTYKCTCTHMCVHTHECINKHIQDLPMSLNTHIVIEHWISKGCSQSPGEVKCFLGTTMTHRCSIKLFWESLRTSGVLRFRLIKCTADLWTWVREWTRDMACVFFFLSWN